jgi:hypothetical protein
MRYANDPTNTNPPHRLRAKTIVAYEHAPKCAHTIVARPKLANDSNTPNTKPYALFTKALVRLDAPTTRSSAKSIAGNPTPIRGPKASPRRNMVEPLGAPIAALADSTTDSHRAATAVTTDDDVVVVIFVRRGVV